MRWKASGWLLAGIIATVTVHEIWPTSSIRSSDWGVYDVTHYGAKADAVEASGCDANEDIPMNCSSHGTGTDNTAAFQAAVDAACAAGGGVVFIPEGKYAFGSGGADATINVFLDCDNLTVAGVGTSTILLPRTTIGMGGGIFEICENNGTTCTASPTDMPEHVTVRDLTIRDDDPFYHGSAWSETISVSDISGAFLYDEQLTFGTGGPTSPVYFYWQSATNGSGVIIYRDSLTQAGCTTCGGTVTGALSGTTATYVSETIDDVGEETHGITVAGNDVLIENVHMEYIGDESFDVGKAATRVTINGNTCWNTPSTPSAGSCISISGGAQQLRITNNNIELGASGTNKGISVSSIDAETDDILIAHNIITEDDLGNADHSVAEYGIIVSPHTENVANVRIEDNLVEFDLDIRGTCSTTTTTTCDAHSECPAGEWCENFTGDAAGGSGGAIIVSEQVGGIANDISITDNEVTGRIYAITSGNSVAINDNELSGTRSSAIRAMANAVNISGNTAPNGYEHYAINIGGAAESVSITGNTFLNMGSDLTGLALVYLTSAVSYLNVTSNTVQGVTVAGANVRGIDCQASPGIVNSNTFADIDYDAIYDCPNVIGNLVDGSGNVGVWLTSSNQGASVVGNTLDSAGTGIYVNGTTNATVSGNNCEDLNGGACISEAGAADENAIVGNTSWDSGGTGAAISCGGASSVCRGNVVQNSTSAETDIDADIVQLSNGYSVEDEFATRCADVIFNGAATSNQTTTMTSTGVFYPLVYANTDQSELNDIEGCFTEDNTDKFEYTYTCATTRTYDVWFVTSFFANGAVNMNAYPGTHSSGDLADGDEITGGDFPRTLAANWRSYTYTGTVTLFQNKNVGMGIYGSTGAGSNITVHGARMYLRQTSPACYRGIQ